MLQHSGKNLAKWISIKLVEVCIGWFECWVKRHSCDNHYWWVLIIKWPHAPPLYSIMIIFINTLALYPSLSNVSRETSDTLKYMGRRWKKGEGLGTRLNISTYLEHLWIQCYAKQRQIATIWPTSNCYPGFIDEIKCSYCFLEASNLVLQLHISHYML